jgi:Flp pilus assembly protein TadD
VLLAVLVIGVYANATQGPFIFDDGASVVENTSIRDLADIGQVLSPPRETPVAGRPLVNLTFALNFASGGADVTGYHVVNIALHLIVALLLWRITAGALGDGWTAFAIAAIWAVHPINSEVVDYITQRTESVMALCLLATVFAVQRLGRGRGARWEAVAVVACALGMAAKESMAVAPLLVVAYDRAFTFDSWADQWRARRRLYAGLAASWIVLIALNAGGPRADSVGFAADGASPWSYLLSQARMITRYLSLLVWPRGLVLNYGYPGPVTFGEVWPYVLFVSAVAAAGVAAAFRSRRVAFLVVWFFVALAPASSIVPITTEVGAERRMYVPSMAAVALFVAAAVAVGDRVRRTQSMTGDTARTAGLTVLAVATAALAAGTAQRNREFQSSLRLAETSYTRHPSPAARSMYGVELAAAGRLLEAERELRGAAEAFPDARYFLGTVLRAQNHPDEALTELEAYIASQPGELDMVRRARLLAADLLVRAGRPADAVAHYQALLRVYADDRDAARLLGGALVRAGRFSDAVDAYHQVLAKAPDDVASWNGLGVAYASLGQIAEARSAFERVLQLDPSNEGARRNLDRIR